MNTVPEVQPPRHDGWGAAVVSTGLGLKHAVNHSPDKPPSSVPAEGDIPPGLRDAPCWVVWVYIRRGDRWTKVPVDPVTDVPADVTDPATLLTFDAALAAVNGGLFDGIGVVLEPAGLVGIDLDDCRNPDTGALAAWAVEIIDALGTYSEVSPSGTGVKAFARAKKPGPKCRAGNVELYSTGRFFTVTGRRLPGSPAEVADNQPAVDALYARVFPAAGRPAAPVPQELPADDQALLERAFAARNGDKVRRLWEGDTTGYPSRSEADLALCALLSFWLITPERVDRAFRRSALYRTKWERADYRERTLAAAVAGRTEFYTPPADDPDGPAPRPRILCGADQHRVNAAAAAALGRLPGVYQKSGLLVHVIDSSAAAAGDPIARAAGVAVVRELPQPLLQDRLSQAAVFLKPGRGPDEPPTPAGPPSYCVAAVHAMGDWPGVRPLDGVVAHPIFLADGSIVSAPGYHPGTGLLLCPPAGLRLAVPDRPTAAEVADAVGLLTDVVCDFPFAAPAHRAVWVAALLTQLARPAFPGPVPLVLIDGNGPGVGKGLLADALALAVTGRRFPVMTYTADRDEFRKQVTSLAIAGERAVLLDNVTGAFGHPELDAALTSDRWRDRLLGGNRLFDGPLRLCWFATGNNCQFRGDLARRVAPVRLESADERPERRTGFRHPDLRRHVLVSREALLSAALTVLRGFHVAGRPAGGLPSWGSFEGWSDLVRECVVWAGLPDPGEAREELAGRADPEAAAVCELFSQIEKFDPPGHGWSAAQLVVASEKREGLRGALQELLHEVTPKKLGYKLRELRGRRCCGGRYLEALSSSGAGCRWVLSRPVAPPVPAAGPAGAGDEGDAGDAGDAAAHPLPE